MKIIQTFLIVLLLSVSNVYAQDYDFYLQKAYEALAENKIDVAKASYNVYKKLTRKNDKDFEKCLLSLSDIFFFF